MGGRRSWGIKGEDRAKTVRGGMKIHSNQIAAGRLGHMTGFGYPVRAI